MNPTFTRGMLDPDTRAEGPLRFVLSSPGMKRDGMELDNRRFRVEAFKRNPVMPWQHGQDIGRGFVPIGRWRNVRLTADDTLVGEAEFDREDAFAADVERKYRNGFLNAVSISWMFGEDRGGLYQDLLEASAVAVPADPDALLAGRSIVLTSDEYRQLRERVDALENLVEAERARAQAIHALRSL